MAAAKKMQEQITEASDLVGWDPPFEIDLGLIRPEDEAYWDEYRTTPKAFIPLQRLCCRPSMKALWSRSTRQSVSRPAGSPMS